jgi:predicted dehydrogenase
MNELRSINVGIAGLGWPGERHAEAIGASPLGNLYAACDLNPERLAAFADTFRPEKLFTNFEEMLRDPALHAVVIGLPNSLHYPFSLKSLEAGKHVICEKPPTMNAPQMQALHDKALNCGRIYYFGRQMRFSPAMETAKRIISERRLGEIYFAETMWVRARGTPSGIDGWFTDRSRAGGGAVIDLGIHAIDAAWYLMGTPQPRAVSAQTYQKFPQLAGNNVFDVEDNAYGMIRFENAATLLFKVCWAANLMEDIPVSLKWGRSLLSTTVYGPKGSLRVTDTFKLDSTICPRSLVLIEEKEGKPQQIELPVNELRGDDLRHYEFAKQDANFLRSIRGDESAINSSSQAVELMKILDAIYRSSQIGAEVRVSLH